MHRGFITALAGIGLLAGLTAASQTAAQTDAPSAPEATSGELTAKPDLHPAATSTAMPGYVLGARDALNIHVVDMEELGESPYPIDLQGNINLPRIGHVHAAGLTVEDLEAQLTADFREFLRDPIVNVNVAEYHSQPVSVLGAVNNPGVHQIQGNKSLFEVISEAGGLRDDAGSAIEITRRLTNGPLPLPNATVDSTGNFSIAELNIRAVMAAKSPEQNIPVKPNDVITVPKADLVYVIGSVRHPGGFPLQEKSTMSVLQALSLAEGLQNTAASNRAKILRTSDAAHGRVEIPVNVKHILAGTDNDIPLLADDILFIPNSAGKTASIRAIEALIQTGSGVAIYAHPF